MATSAIKELPLKEAPADISIPSATKQILALASPRPLADVDANGVVDGNDLLIIQRGLGSTYNSSHVAGFKAEYGLGLSGGAVSAVPEPAAVSLLAAGAAGIPLYRRRLAKQTNK
jgi:hypothetical protein